MDELYDETIEPIEEVVEDDSSSAETISERGGSMLGTVIGVGAGALITMGVAKFGKPAIEWVKTKKAAHDAKTTEKRKEKLIKKREQIDLTLAGLEE